MRTTLTFNSNLESLSDYMTRVAEGLRSIRDDVYTSWGVQRCWKEIYIRVRGYANDCCKKNLDINDITLEMIHTERPFITVKDIKAVIDFTRGKASLSQMNEEDGLEG